MQLRSPVTTPLHEFGWPRPAASTDFRITSPFGWRDDPLNPGHRVFHPALDIGNGRLGYPVVAVAPGTVILASNQYDPPWNYATPASAPDAWGPSYGGNVVVIDHGNGLHSQYAHLGTIMVAKGERVAAGHQVGTVGQSGSAYQRGHLHFGLRDADWIDPEPFVRLGHPYAEGTDLVIFPAADVKLLNNVGCAIRTGTVVRSDPRIADDTKLFTTPSDEQKGWHPIAQVTGDVFNGSSAWYAGWLQVPGKGTAIVFVHSARCTPLEPVEKPAPIAPTPAVALDVIKEALGL